MILLSEKESVAASISLGMSWVPKCHLVLSPSSMMSRLTRDAQSLGCIWFLRDMIKDTFQILSSKIYSNQIATIKFSINCSSNKTAILQVRTRCISYWLLCVTFNIYKTIFFTIYHGNSVILGKNIRTKTSMNKTMKPHLEIPRMQLHHRQDVIHWHSNFLDLLIKIGRLVIQQYVKTWNHIGIYIIWRYH